MTDRKRKVKEFAYLQLKEFLIVFLYLWVIFALFALHKAIILSQENIEYKALGFAVINALALAKVMVVAKELNLADKFKDKPLIYPTLLKSLVFALLLMVVKVLEEVIVRVYHGNSFAESLSALTDQSAKVIFSAGLLMFVMLIPFFAFTELSRHFGEGRLATLFLRSRENWLKTDASPATLEAEGRTPQ